MFPRLARRHLLGLGASSGKTNKTKGSKMFALLARVFHKFSVERLILIAVFSLVLNTHAQKKVLFYGPTHQVGGVAENFVNNSPGEFAPIGSGSAIWTPGHSSAALDWSKKTSADFAAFDAIVVGEPIDDMYTPDSWTGAIANRAIWSAAVTGNVLLFAGDPENHASAPLQGAMDLIKQAIRFAADDPSAGPGLYITFADVDPELPSPIDSTQPCISHLLSGLGSFSLRHGLYDSVKKLVSHPVTDCLSEVGLSSWDKSSHSGFTSWPSGYLPLAMVIDAFPNDRTPVGSGTPGFPAGSAGLVHILAKGGTPFHISPVTAGKLVSDLHTVTVTYLPNQNVIMDVISGPNASQGPQTINTGASGSVTWDYYGTGGVGRDVITATIDRAPPACPGVVVAVVEWANQLVSIAATDPTASEPPTSGGVANTGTFTISRSSSVGAFNVSLILGGTASVGEDYTHSTIPVAFSAGQLSRTVDITPEFDGDIETTETVVVRIVPNTSTPLNFAVGSASEATVNITSTETSTVTLSVVDNSADESGQNSATMRLQRTSSVGTLDVHLGFTGTASFGADYIVDGIEVEPPARVTIGNGQTTKDITIIPVPDTRAESAESVTIKILPDPEGAYTVGGTFQQSVTITDDDSVVIPANGWKITTITTGNIGSLAINTVPDGLGGWRGQVAGFKNNSTTPTRRAFFWDNGNFSYRDWPTSWSYTDAQTEAVSLNDNGTIVGFAGYAWNNSGGWQYGFHSCYWNAGQTYPVLLSALSGQNSENRAVDINNRDAIQGIGGIIIGNNMQANGKMHAVAWVPNGSGNYGSPTDLEDLTGVGNKSSYAAAINDFADHVGKSQIASGNNYHAFRAVDSNSDDVPDELSPAHDMGTATYVNAHTSEGKDINNYGEMVGASQMPINQYRAAYKTPYSAKDVGWRDLGVLGSGSSAGNQSIALGINDHGLIVGQSTLKIGSSYFWRAFVVSNQGEPGSQAMLNLAEQTYAWTDSGWQRADLNGWTFTKAEKVNNSNWIVAFGSKSGTSYALVLSPR